jgi:flagellar biosynthesis/type III secretory pathway protein FliH
MNKTILILPVLVALFIGFGTGYSSGKKTGYQAGYKTGDSEGYKRAEADIKKLEQAAAEKTAAEAAKAANPFQTVNPLEAVSANPFEKAKKVLNPFQ